MTEKDLVQLWNDKRTQLIRIQFHSVVALAVLVVLALMGFAESASGAAVNFALIFLVTVGALGVLTQFAIIREARSVVEELGKLENLGVVAKNISQSGSFLTMTQGLMAAFSVAVVVGFALVVL